jgi:lysine 2,3-aminomutase
MYCRFCFRKSLLNELQPDLFGGSLEKAIAYIASTPNIEEIIFSGGDPLMASDNTLRAVIAQLATIPHLRRLRFHSRVPVTFPTRVTETLVSAITTSPLPVVVVSHFNHPKEITEQSAEACRKLRAGGVFCLNQSVLLRGVNDELATLKLLSEQIFAVGVLPYYLHHPDRSQGTQHFMVEAEEGLRLHEALRIELPGYLVPRYVIDTVDCRFKVNVETLLNRRRSPA